MLQRANDDVRVREFLQARWDQIALDSLRDTLRNLDDWIARVRLLRHQGDILSVWHDAARECNPIRKAQTFLRAWCLSRSFIFSELTMSVTSAPGAEEMAPRSHIVIFAVDIPAPVSNAACMLTLSAMCLAESLTSLTISLVPAFQEIQRLAGARFDASFQ